MSYDRPRDGQTKTPCEFSIIQKGFDYALRGHLRGVDEALEGVQAQLTQELELIRNPGPKVVGGAVIMQPALF